MINNPKPGKRKAGNNPDPLQAGQDETVIRKRGRPKGSKNSVKRVSPSRPEQSVITEPGENTKYILHDMKLSALPAIDVNNPDQMQQRINDYFRICSEDDIKPSVSSLGLAFGISRITLFNWITGKTNTLSNTTAINTLKRAYDSINSYYEHMLNNGKINPVSGIFLLKNNYGYQDTTQHIIQANNDQTLSLTDITDRAGLLEE